MAQIEVRTNNRQIIQKVKDRTISNWNASLILISVIVLFVIYMTYSLTNTLSTKNWCSTTIDAKEQLQQTGAVANINAASTIIGNCIELQKQIISALSFNSYILTVTIGICMIGLVILAMIGGKISADIGKDGFKLDLEKEDNVNINAETADVTSNVANVSADTVVETKPQ